MSKPAFVCVHGSWHNPAFFDKVKSILLRHEYSCVCPSLPSVGGNPPTYDFAPDVNVIRSSVEAIVKERDVIVVMHSYGGIPGGTALNGLDKKSCQEKGLKGGVVRLVYVNSFIVPEGFQHSPRDTREHMVPTMKTNIEVSVSVFQSHSPVFNLVSCCRLVSLLSTLKMPKACSIKTCPTMRRPNGQQL